MMRGSARRVVSTLLFLALAAALGLVLLLSVEDALAHSLHAPAWAVALWRALVFGAGGFLAAIAGDLADDDGDGAEAGTAGDGAADPSSAPPRERERQAPGSAEEGHGLLRMRSVTGVEREAPPTAEKISTLRKRGAAAEIPLFAK